MRELKDTLERAAAFRFAARLFEPPTPQRVHELAGLADVLPKPRKPLADSIAQLAREVSSGEHHRLVGHAGVCRDTESAYVADPFGARGQIVADVAGFYRAFKYEPPIELAVASDHISVELDFLAYLAFKEAYALFSNDTGNAGLCRDAAIAFFEDHLGRWANELCDRLIETAPSGFYAEAARFLRAILKERRGTSEAEGRSVPRVRRKTGG